MTRQGTISRLLALLLLLLPLLAVAGMALLLNQAEMRREELAERISLLARRAVSLDQLVAERDALAETGPGNEALAGQTSAVAGAALQHRIDRLLTEQGATVESLLVLPAVDEPGYRRIALRVAFSARITNLRDIVQAIEAGPPALFVQSLSVRNATVESSADPTLTVSLDVYGYVRAPESGA
jgi:hypothetical protein